MKSKNKDILILILAVAFLVSTILAISYYQESQESKYESQVWNKLAIQWNEKYNNCINPNTISFWANDTGGWIQTNSPNEPITFEALWNRGFALAEKSGFFNNGTGCWISQTGDNCNLLNGSVGGVRK